MSSYEAVCGNIDPPCPKCFKVSNLMGTSAILKTAGMALHQRYPKLCGAVCVIKVVHLRIAEFLKCSSSTCIEQSDASIRNYAFDPLRNTYVSL